MPLPSYFCNAMMCIWVLSICSAISFILSGLSIVMTFHVPIFIHRFVFRLTRFSLYPFIHPTFLDWNFLAAKFFRGWVAGLAPNPQPGGPGSLSSCGFYPLTCPCLVVPAGSYATAGIALGVTVALILPQHVKVETPSGENSKRLPNQNLALISSQPLPPLTHLILSSIVVLKTPLNLYKSHVSS